MLEKIVKHIAKKKLSKNMQDLHRYCNSSTHRLQVLIHSPILTLMLSKFSLHWLGRYAVMCSMNSLAHQNQTQGTVFEHEFLNLAENSISLSEVVMQLFVQVYIIIFSGINLHMQVFIFCVISSVL